MGSSWLPRGPKDNSKEEVIEQNQTTNAQGALSPLLGDLGGLKDHPSEDTGAKKTSQAPVEVSEARGRSSKDKQPDKKNIKKALEHWAQGPNKGTKGLTMEPRGQGRRAAEDS